jgi:UDP-glucose 4-epimerase
LSRTALVTGAGGFLGGAFARSLSEAGWTVAALGRGPRPAWSRSSWITDDVSASSLAEATREAGPPEVVFHAAGGASVGASLADPARDRARTVGSLEALLAFLRAEAPNARLVYPSSGAVYGAAAPGPIPETAPLRPVSPYGAHKVEAEALIAEMRQRAVIIRYFSIYGPALHKQLLWELMNRLAGNPAEVVLAGHGDEVRDFLHVDDAVALARRAAEPELSTSPLILNGGFGAPVTVRDLAEGLVRAMGSRATIRFSGEVRPGDPGSLVADMARAGSLGFSPEIALGPGLRRLAEGFRLGLDQPGAY